MVIIGLYIENKNLTVYTVKQNKYVLETISYKNVERNKICLIKKVLIQKSSIY